MSADEGSMDSSMGRTAEEAEELRKLDWETFYVERLAARKARKGQTPPVQAHDPFLVREAALCRERALGKVLSAEPSEKETTCLRNEKAPGSSDQPELRPRTGEAPSNGESERLARLTKMAEEDLDILETRRMQRISPESKGRK